MQEHIKITTKQTYNQLDAKEHVYQRYSVADDDHALKNMTNTHMYYYQACHTKIILVRIHDNQVHTNIALK